jgi:ribosome-associated protein
MGIYPKELRIFEASKVNYFLEQNILKEKKEAPKKKAVVKKPVAKKTTAKKTVKESATKKNTTKKSVVKKDKGEQLAESIVFGMQEKKAEDIVTINLKNIKNSIADYFIICHCESRTQAQAIADSVEEQVYKKSGESAWHKEGRENSEWILLDYSNVVVHIFLRDKREFYGLERLWGDAEIKHINVS